MIKKLIEKIKDILFENGVYLVSSYEYLPPPLNKDEEYEFIMRCSLGDNDAKNYLVEHNLRLVVYIARKFESNLYNLEDLISIGTIGLIKAVNTYNPQKCIKLATYASKCIENEILMYIRKNCKRKAEVSLDEPLNYDADGNELVLSDVLCAEDNSVGNDLEKECEKQILREALENLSDTDYEIISMRFGINESDRKTQKEVADFLNISQSYISRLEKKIIGNLKKEILKTSK